MMKMSDNNQEDEVEQFAEDLLRATEQDKSIEQVRIERAIEDFVGEETIEHLKEFHEEMIEESERAGDEDE